MRRSRHSRRRFQQYWSPGCRAQHSPTRPRWTAPGSLRAVRRTLAGLVTACCGACSLRSRFLCYARARTHSCAPAAPHRASCWRAQLELRVTRLQRRVTQRREAHRRATQRREAHRQRRETQRRVTQRRLQRTRLAPCRARCRARLRGWLLTRGPLHRPVPLLPRPFQLAPLLSRRRGLLHWRRRRAPHEGAKPTSQHAWPKGESGA